MVCKKIFALFLLIFTCCFTLNGIAQEVSTEQFIKSLQDEGSIGLLDLPATNIFKEVCGSQLPNNLTRDVNTFCNIVRSSETCSAVDDKDKISCENYTDSREFDFTEFIGGCAQGVADFGKEMVEVAWSIMKWVFEKRTNPIATYQEAREYSESVKLYLITEYDKAYEQSSQPFKGLRAAKAVLGTIGDIIFNAIQNYLYTEYKEFGCLNFQARAKFMCKVIPSFVLPPAGLLALIKKGPKALGKIDLVKSEKFKFALAKRRKLAEKSLRRTDLSDIQIKEIEKAHLVGEGQKGKDPTRPAEVGNYTFAQLKEKNKILKDADFSPEEVRKLMADGVVGISSKGFGSLFPSTKLRPIGDANFDRFRESFNNGTIDGENVYISYMENSDLRLPGKVISSSKNGIVIETPEGKKVNIKKNQLETVKYSSTSQEAFSTPSAPAAKPNAANSPRVVVTPIAQNRPLLAVSGDTAYDNFRADYNNGKISGDNQFVSVPFGEDRLAAKVSSVLPDGSLVVDAFDTDGVVEQLVIAKKHLGEVRVSSTSKEAYQSLPDVKRPKANPAAETNRYKFSGVKVNDYKSRGGETIEVNLDSPKLQKWANEATDIIEQSTGIKPGSSQNLSAEDREKIYQAWLKEVVPRIEDQGQNYASARDLIIRSGGGKADLGEITDNRAAVCRELSICGSVLFNEYGISSNVVTGDVYTNTPNFGGHAWIQILDSKGKPLELVDSNNTRSVHPDIQDYESSTQGVKVIRELEVVR